MKRRAYKVSGFTMIEQVMALLIACFSIMLLLSSVQFLYRLDDYLMVPEYLEWHLFITQLNQYAKDYELASGNEAKFESIQSPNGKKETWLLKYSQTHKAGSVIYLSKNHGYQPLLIGFTKCRLKRVANYLEMNVQTNDGVDRQLNFVPSKKRILKYTNNKRMKKVYVKKRK